MRELNSSKRGDTMAGKAQKPLEQREPNEAEPAVEFSSLATGLSCAIRAEKAMRERPLGEPGPEIEQAWQLLTDPRWIALTALAQTSAKSGQGAMAVDDCAPGWSQRQALVCAAGLNALSAEIEGIAKSSEFARAARAYAPMVATPAGQDKMLYPWLQWGARLGPTSTGGRKRQGFAGVGLGSISIDSIPRYSTDRGSAYERWSDGREGVSMLVEAAKKFDKETWVQHNQSRSVASPSLEAATGLGGQSSLVGDYPLPSVAALEESLKAAQLAPSWFAMEFSNPKPLGSRSTLFHGVEDAAKEAIGKAWVAALSTLSAAMAPVSLDAALPSRRDGKLALWGGPVAQALSRSTKLDNVFPSSLLLEELNEVVPPLDEPRQRWRASDLGFKLSRLAARGEAPVEAALESFRVKVQNLAKVPANQKDRARARGQVALEEVSFGAFGTGVEGLSAALRSGDARVGLAQWGCALLEDMGVMATRSNFSPEKILECQPPEKKELAQALLVFGKALRQAQNLFAQKAFEAGRERERTWVESSGQGQAWRQAQASGSLTQKSILWALENPIDQSVSSSQDPLARLAGAASRPLGILAGQPEAMKAALRAELGERGLDDAGWEALAQSAQAREMMSTAFGFMSGQNGKSAVKSGDAALSVACKAASAAGAEGLDSEASGMFVQTLAQSTRGMNGEKAREEEVERWNEHALGSAWRSTRVASSEEAKALAARAQAMRAGQKELYGALARDWKESLEASARQGVDLDVAKGIASERAKTFARVAPASTKVAWERSPFATEPAWKMFNVESARLGAAIEASKKEGPLGVWHAKAAVAFGIKDASDANHLAAQSKACARSVFGFGEGAWKAVIKSPDGLALMEKTLDALIQQRSNSWGAKTGARLIDSAWAQETEAAVGSGMEARFGLALNSAMGQGIDSQLALEAFTALESMPHRSAAALFSTQLPESSVDGAEAALFFAAEFDAKLSRMPKVFKEICKRLQVHQLRAKQALERGEDAMDPKTALQGEARDLCDWISGSGYGLWQTLPPEPTWGQLERLSRAWHDEEAAREADKQARAKAQEQEASVQRRLAPFAPTSGEHWEPVLGKFERDGWEAVELTSQGMLSEEGSAMSHCVSSFSGKCREGELRIFSIRLNGERRCTMELRAQGGRALGQTGREAHFSITQNKGKHNAGVSNKATLAFCAETVVAADAAWTLKWEAIQKLIREAEEKRKAKEAAAREQRKTPKAPGPKP
jgi:hypothetical protein